MAKISFCSVILSFDTILSNKESLTRQLEQRSLYPKFFLNISSFLGCIIRSTCWLLHANYCESEEFPAFCRKNKLIYTKIIVYSESPVPFDANNKMNDANYCLTNFEMLIDKFCLAHPDTLVSTSN